MGYRAAALDLAPEEMPESLRNGLWDACSDVFFSSISLHNSSYNWSPGFKNTASLIWRDFFTASKDKIPAKPKEARAIIREEFYKSDFFRVYEFLEFMVSIYSSHPNMIRYFSVLCNGIFDRERAAFRMIDGLIIQITNDVEVSEVGLAANLVEAPNVAAHIKSAMALYGRRENPDYRNSIKESVSAVEAAAAFMLDRKGGTLGAALSELRRTGQLHPALADGFSKLYGYTSDAEGIRHALMDEPTLTQADARYMIVTCSAFANLLISLKRK